MSRSEGRRFSRAEVAVHAAFSALVLVAVLTAAALYVDTLSQLVGRRALVAQVHLVAGLLIPVPLALGLLSGAFRDDVRRLDRWSPADRAWLRSRDRRSGRLPVDRFNAGQKLNAAFTLGAVLVLLGTGTVMGSLLGAWPDRARTGATLVHDWTAFALVVAVAGHLWFVSRYRRGDAVYPRADERAVGGPDGDGTGRRRGSGAGVEVGDQPAPGAGSPG
jgi:cytochrome b subunit of formate dehydrogenase